MGSFERKLERNRLKEAHKRLKKQWRAENVRRAAGVEVPVTDGDSVQQNGNRDPKPQVSTLPNSDTGDATVPFVPTVKTKRLPMLGRPPTLGQYKKVVENVVAQAKEAQAKQLAAQAAEKADAEKKVDLEWKDE